jgi:hypothetical protein
MVELSRLPKPRVQWTRRNGQRPWEEVLMPRIVVGVDGSEGSRRALLWAVDEATLRGADLEVIYAYEYHPAWLDYGGFEGVTTAAQAEPSARTWNLQPARPPRPPRRSSTG